MKKIVFIALISFVLNFIWEISQAFLYAPHYVGIAGLLTVHLRASLGDMLMIFIILSLDAFIFDRIFTRGKITIARLARIIFAGFLLAAIIEKYALATERWSYGPLMPIIPWLNVGLLPLLQMILIPLVIFAIWMRYGQSRSNAD